MFSEWKQRPSGSEGDGRRGNGEMGNCAWDVLYDRRLNLKYKRESE